MCEEEGGGRRWKAEGGDSTACGIEQHLSGTKPRKIGLSLMTFPSIETCTAKKMTNLRTCASGFVLVRSSYRVRTICRARGAFIVWDFTASSPRGGPNTNLQISPVCLSKNS